jgi:DNA polymerase III subunit gamma/tau
MLLPAPHSTRYLKTLEEPPAHAVIVLATTEYEKLPPTITSRAQRFTFKKLPKSIIMEKLQMMARAEKIKIDDDALELIAAAGEGSLRDAESLLGQIASLSSAGNSGDGNGKASAKTDTKTPPIDLATAERVVGRTGLRKVHEFAELIIKKELKGALAQLTAVEDEGHNLIQFTKDLIHYLRKVLSLKINPALETTFAKDLTRDEIAEAKKLGATADPAFLIKIIKALIRAYAEMRYSPFAIVPLEIALAEQLS